VHYISNLLWNYINQKSHVTAFCTVGGMVSLITEKVYLSKLREHLKINSLGEILPKCSGLILSDVFMKDIIFNKTDDCM
jgi:hypothetical protein